jgi:hypothetical protein
MSHADTLGNMRVLDTWQAAVHHGRIPSRHSTVS